MKNTVIILRHPSLRPLLEAWRTARTECTRINTDGRYGLRARQKAEKAQRTAFEVYRSAARALGEII